jgi:hypothetical protein
MGGSCGKNVNYYHYHIILRLKKLKTLNKYMHHILQDIFVYLCGGVGQLKTYQFALHFVCTVNL